MSPTIVDVAFQAEGAVPLDSGYLLYAALCQIYPHAEDDRRHWLQAHPLVGPVEGGLRRISQVVVRVESDRVSEVLLLKDRVLSLGGQRLHVRAAPPEINALSPYPALYARLLFRPWRRPPGSAEEALDHTRRSVLQHLGAIGVRAEIIALDLDVLRIKGHLRRAALVGLDQLRPEESLRLQGEGLGFRRSMGCGIFVPGPEGAALLDQADPLARCGRWTGAVSTEAPAARRRPMPPASVPCPVDDRPQEQALQAENLRLRREVASLELQVQNRNLQQRAAVLRRQLNEEAVRRSRPPQGAGELPARRRRPLRSGSIHRSGGGPWSW